MIVGFVTLMERFCAVKLGIDIGSTTTKLVVLDQEEILFQKYIRHLSRQRESVISLLSDVPDLCGSTPVQICFTGSGARALATRVQLPFTQEVVANAEALKHFYSKVGSAIELGGQDAKIIFFRENKNHEPEVYDMRMNGSCAGGTGAFIDEVAAVLGVTPPEMKEMADQGESVYDISGRCGVFAKTDIQALLNQGVKKEDIALSSYHAIAKQTIGGLSQGLEITPPVAFEGGPLTFHPRLVTVFAERLHLSAKDILIPERPEMMVAYGAALSLDALHAGCASITVAELLTQLRSLTDDTAEEEAEERYFTSATEKVKFFARHPKKEVPVHTPRAGEVLNVYLGIDSGSTTTKLVLIDEHENLVDSFYAHNEGSPLDIARDALLKIYEKYEAAGAELNILGAASTGYGEYLFSTAFRTETHIVETVAHALAASRYSNNPTFLLDIGGQDMKAIWLEDGIITNIVVNEA